MWHKHVKDFLHSCAACQRSFCNISCKLKRISVLLFSFSPRWSDFRFLLSVLFLKSRKWPRSWRVLPASLSFSFCFSATYLFANARTSRKEPKAHFSFWVNIAFFPLSSEFQFTVGVWSVLWGTHGTAKCSMRTSTHCTRRLTSSAVHSHAWAYKKLCNFLLSFLSKCQIGRS